MRTLGVMGPLLEALPGGALIVDAGGVIISLNAAIETLLGRPRAALVGSHIESLFDAQDRPRVRRAFSHQGADELRLEFRVPHDAEGRWLEMRANRKRGPDGQAHWVALMADIDERQHKDDALSTSRAQLYAALEAGSMGAWIWDLRSGEVIWQAPTLMLSQSFRSLDRWPSIDDVISVVHPEDRVRLRTLLEQAIASGTQVSGEYRILAEDGAVRWMTFRGRVERDAEGRPARLLGVNTDVTERKSTEEAQLRSQKLEALGTLAGGIAHDFNNMLLAIRGNAQLAIDDLTADHPAMDSIYEIQRAAIRASDLVQRILAFSRPEAAERERVHVAVVADEALRLMRATLPAMVEIRTEFAGQLPAIEADPTQLHQVIVNLATNAAHAIGSRPGVITVRCTPLAVDEHLARSTTGLQPGPYVRLEVSDTGSGMTREVMRRIFDPFFTTKSPGIGTGLGLSVVHAIVQTHGGAVAVRSEIGKGSVFSLFFPAIDGAGETRTLKAADPVRGSGQRILYVDDEEPLVFLAQRLLSRLGYKVTGECNPLRALALFSERPDDFDVVITDLAMPGLTGHDFTRRVLEIRPAIPILLTSGYIRPEDEQTARELGVRALIMKPNTMEELGAAIAAALGRTAAPQTGVRPP